MADVDARREGEIWFAACKLVELLHVTLFAGVQEQLRTGCSAGVVGLVHGGLGLHVYFLWSAARLEVVHDLE